MKYICTPQVFYSGDYAKKVNLADTMRVVPLLVLAADDLCFHAGGFERAMEQVCSDVGVIGTNDLTNSRTQSERHSTHSFVTREYVERYGTIDVAQ